MNTTGIGHEPFIAAGPMPFCMAESFEGIEMMFECRRGALLLIGMLLAGCYSNPPPGGLRLKTYPVTGIVTVDGEPVEGITIKFHPQDHLPELKRAVSAGTGEDGEISVATYTAGDGLPAGTYKLTFELRQEEILDTNSTAKLARFGERPTVDRLQGAYSDITKSTHEVTIEAGSTNDLGVIELSTKSTSM